MANTTLYIAINKGKSGFQPDDVTIGSTSSAASDFEFRSETTDANGNVLTRLDMCLALEAIRRVIESNAVFTDDLLE